MSLPTLALSPEAREHPLASINGLALVLAFCDLSKCGGDKALPAVEREFWIVRRGLRYAVSIRKASA